MAHLNPDTLFASWTLTDEETVIGSVLTTLQKQVMQNRISQMAHEKIMLKYDPANPQAYMQQDAELQGQILILQNLITISNEAEARLNNPSQE